MTAVLEDIRVPRAGKGRPRTRPDRVLADKGYPSRANRAWLREPCFNRLKGSTTWNAGIIRPSITTKSERIVESGRSVNDDSPAAANAPSHVTTVTVSGTGHNVATHSPGAVQTTTVTMTEENRKLVLPVADNLDGLLQSGLLGLNDEQSAEAAEVAAELRRVADEPEVQGKSSAAPGASEGGGHRGHGRGHGPGRRRAGGPGTSGPRLGLRYSAPPYRCRIRGGASFFRGW
jgi:hypothetical protein